MSDDRRPDDPIDELLGAYALDAVDEVERARVEAHLAVDRQARAEVASYREVAALLALGTERPPEGLWDRIAGALEEPPPAPGPRLAQVMPIETAPSRRRTALRIAAAAAAAAVVAVAVTAVVVGGDDAGTGDATIAAACEDAFGAPGGRRTELVGDDPSFSAEAVLLPDGTGCLAAAQLTALPDTETWQLWGVYGDEDVISLGVLGSRPEVQTFTAHDDIRALVITRERAGGVPQSTTGAVLVGELA